MLNKVVIMGRLTKDPDLRYTSTNNTPVSSFTLAVNRRFNRQGEEKQADFIPIVAWSKLAEFSSNYLSKGSQVVVSGRIQTRSWEDNDGKRHYVTEVVADEIHFAEGKRNDTQQNKSPDNNEDGFYTIDDDELPF